MNDASSERRERLEMLLADEAVGHLSDEERGELNGLLAEFPDVDRESYQRAAAAMDLAFAEKVMEADLGQLPDSMRQSILDAAPEYLKTVNNSKPANGPEILTKAVGSARLAVPNRIPPSSNGSAKANLNSGESTVGLSSSNQNLDSDHQDEPVGQRTELLGDSGGDPWKWLGWAVATAAVFCLLLLNFPGLNFSGLNFSGQGFLGQGQQGDDTTVAIAGGDLLVTEASFQQRRSELLGRPSTKQIAWTPGPTPLDAEVSGDVVWNQAEQAGYMTFDGLPVNDPSVQQYQLWIIDPQRDQHPIDGGVFDIKTDGKVVVPIDAKLEVLDPKAFAITIEKPGGVVVSDQSQLPLLAPVE